MHRRTPGEEAWLAAIVESAEDAMFIRDLDGTILTWNIAAQRIFGYTRDEIVGRHFSILVPERRHQLENEIFELVASGQRVPRYETQRVRKDGTLIDVSITNQPIRDASGDVVAVSTIGRDITPEKVVRRERDVLAGIVNSALGAIISLDANGIVTSWNVGAERMFGYSAAEAIGQASAFLAPPDRKDEARGLLAKLLDGREVVDFETVRMRKDGTLLDVVLTASAIRDREGELIGVAGLYHDVTAMKAARDALARSETQLRDAQRTANLGSWELDLQTGATHLSDEMARLLGYDLDDVDFTLEDALDDIVLPDDRAAAVRTLERSVAERSSFQTEVRCRRRDGAVVHLEIRGRVTDAADGRTYVSGTALDVTERRRLEEQLMQSQKMEALGGLAGGIAHDFNNLLAVILNYGRFIQEDLPPDHPAREDIREMVRAAERGAGLVRQLLSFARREVVRPEPINLNVLVSQLEPLLRRAVAEDITLDIRPGEGLWNTEADRGQIEQLLLNLVVNARDAMPAGGRITIETSNIEADAAFVATRPNMAPGRYAALVVSDTGVGIDKATQSRIFEPFFTTKPRGSGTGLGLASVYGIVTRAGGDISVYSEMGIGTTFKIYLPISDLQVNLETNLEQDEVVPFRGRGERVLVVEDEEPVLRLITRILGEAGYAPVGLGSPQDALDLLTTEGGVDLLLTDVIMPEMSGRTLSDSARLPTIFMSGYTDSVIEQQGVLQRGVLFLPKPFSRNELLSIVRSTLDGTFEIDLTGSEDPAR